MNQFLRGFVTLVAKIHDRILTINDQGSLAKFGDKQLHFIVFGIFGMLLFFLVYALFKGLSERHLMTIAFIYVLTVLIGLAFAIEIGQGITDTGTMEFGDIVFGITGFVVLYAIFAVVLEIITAIKNGLKQIFKK